MKQVITLTLRAEDAEPILRQAAENAARYSSYLDYVGNLTVDKPGGDRPSWQIEFLKAKRMVEAFGVEYEQVGEAETLGVYIPTITLKSKTVRVGGLVMEHVTKSKPEPDRKKWFKRLDRSVHAEACRQAAERVVRRWRT